MEVIPAIDLKSGRCVRLYQGDFRRETVYSEDPPAMALHWQEQGASRLHLVDLDGAAAGSPQNAEIIFSIIERLDIPVQVGGGIREAAEAEKFLDGGAGRVVLGTAAVEDPSLVRHLCQKYGSERVVVAVDARDGEVAIKGWTKKTSMSSLTLAQQMANYGVRRLLYTDISRDGTLTEPNFAANARLVQETGMAVIASGGVASADHIRRLVDTGVEGVVVGSALYSGALALAEAVAASGQTE